jgi:hypothetical protein
MLMSAISQERFYAGQTSAMARMFPCHGSDVSVPWLGCFRAMARMFPCLGSDISEPDSGLYIVLNDIKIPASGMHIVTGQDKYMYNRSVAVYVCIQSKK